MLSFFSSLGLMTAQEEGRIYPRTMMASSVLDVLRYALEHPRLHLLHINPGAAGIYGFHQVRTLVRFCMDQGEFSDLEVIELQK